MNIITHYRFCLIVLCSLFLSLAGLTQAQAAPADEARQQLETTVNQVLVEIQKPELTNPATREQVLNNIESIVMRLFDFNELSKRTVGQHWNSFTADQQQRFEAAFTHLLRETYLEQLGGYKGETVTYSEATVSSDGKRVEIPTTIQMTDKPVPVTYRMMNKGTWVVYDVIIEGVSLVQNYRSQFQDVMSRGDAERLIDLVEQKAREVGQQKK